MSKQMKLGNNGFTLVEIMLSIAILALISIPLMKYFSDALGYAGQTAQKQKATLIAQETIEVIKAQRKIVKPYTGATPVPGSTETPRNYDLAPELISLFNGKDGTSPEVVIPNKFYETGATRENNGESIATKQLVYRYVDKRSGEYYIEVGLTCDTPASEVSSPAILGIDDSKNVVIAERTEEMDAITHFSTLNINNYMNWNGGMFDDPDLTPSPTPDDEFEYLIVTPGPDDPPIIADPTPLSEAEIRENMDKIIYITIKQTDDGKFTVTASYLFFCEDVFGPGTNSDMSYTSSTICETTVETLEGIFLMFNKLNPEIDNIQISWLIDDESIPYPDFRFVIQDDIVVAGDDEGETGEGETGEGETGEGETGEDETGEGETGEGDDEDFGSDYKLKINFYHFTHEENPVVHSNLPQANFKFVDVFTPITSTVVDEANESPRGSVSVESLTGSGVPVRIFDIEVNVYANKKAYDAHKEPLVSLKTTKVE